jgi:hypothetical protein
MEPPALRHEGRRLAPGQWWACERPEQPPDPDRTVFYPGRCEPCRLALRAWLARRDSPSTPSV